VNLSRTVLPGAFGLSRQDQLSTLANWANKRKKVRQKNVRQKNKDLPDSGLYISV